MDDTLGEVYEMINHLSVCIDAYGDFVNKEKCKELIDIYEVSCRQITKLKQNWQDYQDKRL